MLTSEVPHNAQQHAMDALSDMTTSLRANEFARLVMKLQKANEFVELIRNWLKANKSTTRLVRKIRKANK